MFNLGHGSLAEQSLILAIGRLYGRLQCTVFAQVFLFFLPVLPPVLLAVGLHNSALRSGLTASLQRKVFADSTFFVILQVQDLPL